MKRNLLVAALLAAACCGSASAQSKISGAGRLMLESYRTESKANARKAPAKDAAKKTMLVTLNPGASADAIEEFGAEIYTDLGDILIVGLELDRVEELAALDQVKAIDFGSQSHTYMDVARENTGLNGVHDGSAEGLGGHGYTGKGVVVGLYDTGLDPNHAAFRDADGKSRVNSIYVMRDGGKDEAYVTAEQVAAFDTEDNKETHGTHVLGIIAGSNTVQGRYAQTGKSGVQTGTIPYYGAAPDAEIVIGCGDFYDTEILRGVAQVVNRAKELGKPAVVNLSLGSNVGPHDPNSATSRTLDRLAEDAIICISAGNEGESRIHVRKPFTLKGKTLNTFISPVNNPTALVYYRCEFWANNNEPFEFNLLMYNKSTGKEETQKITNLGGRTFTWGNNNCTMMAGNFAAGSGVTVTSDIDANTNRYYVSITASLEATNPNIKFGAKITGTKGNSVDGYVSALGLGYYSLDYVEFTDEGITGFTPGDLAGSINEMATGKNLVSVGAYVSRNQSTPYIAGGGYAGNGTRNDIAAFSSYGKTADGRDLPIICAPGAQITSAVNRYCTSYTQAYNEEKVPAISNLYNRISPYYPMQGTSMSSPFAAGTIATWLEAYPQMTSQECIDILTRTAKQDNYTSKTENLLKWGNGKLDPVAGLKEAIKLNASIDNVSADIDDRNIVVRPLGGRLYEFANLGSEAIVVELYNLQGAKVASIANGTDTATLDAGALADGIYVATITANGATISRKMAIR